MESYAARCASFTPAGRSKSILRWPHPETYVATPTSLATAGFYFSPSAATPDAVSCFMCDKGLADWDPDDDPSHIHAQKCPKCPWAMLRCITDPIEDGSIKFTSSSRQPRSRSMEKARLATFGPETKRWWPHEAKNKGPASKTMAKAGFIYTPSSPKDDTCLCIYCGTQLGGWQPEDDPMEEHRMRQSKNGVCPFFRPASPKSKAPPTTPPASDPANDDEARCKPPGNKSSTRTLSASTSCKKPTNGVKPTKSRSSKKAAKNKMIKEEVVKEYHVALEEDEDAPPKPRPKPRRAGSRSSSRSRSRSCTSSNVDTGTLRDEVQPNSSSGSRKDQDGLSPLPSTPPLPPPPSAIRETIPATVKFPQLVPEDTLISLTEAERAMTVEQWVRHEMDRQYERLKSDGRQKIDAFKARAAEVARQLEDM